MSYDIRNRFNRNIDIEENIEMSAAGDLPSAVVVNYG